MSDEDDFEELADQIDSPKISALSLSVASDLSFGVPSLNKNLTSIANMGLSPSTQHALKLVSSGMNMTGLPLSKAMSPALTPVGMQTMNEPLPGLLPPGIKTLSDTLSTINAMPTMPISSLQPTIDSFAAFADLPDGIFSTAIAASTVSSHARTTPTPTPSPSGTDSVEAPATPNYDDIDAKAPSSLYLNSAHTIAQYIAYRIDGLSQQQRAAAAILIAAGIAAGAAQHHPRISETPVVAGSSVISVGMLLQLFWGVGEQD